MLCESHLYRPQNATFHQVCLFAFRRAYPLFSTIIKLYIPREVKTYALSNKIVLNTFGIIQNEQLEALIVVLMEFVDILDKKEAGEIDQEH